jgi:hypothetical protein
LRRSRKAISTEPGSSLPYYGSPAAETAWHIHAALLDWTGKVDSKASFVLAAESAMLAGFIGLGTVERRFASSAGQFRLICAWSGFCGLILALLLAVAVVAPRQYRRSSIPRWQDDFIYFGHLRHWSSAQLCRALTTDPVPILSRNLVAMSKIVWRKHCLMQASILIAAVSLGLILVAALA